MTFSYRFAGIFVVCLVITVHEYLIHQIYQTLWGIGSIGQYCWINWPIIKLKDEIVIWGVTSYYKMRFFITNLQRYNIIITIWTSNF